MNAPQRPAAPASGTHSPLHSDPEIAAELEALAADPEIQELLRFEPVPRQNTRADGWFPELQRKFILHLARTGSPGKACEALGKRRSGIDKLYKVAGAASFRAAWHDAVEYNQKRRAAQAEAEHAALANVKPPFVDHRRKHAPPPEPAPAGEQFDLADDDKWDLIHTIGLKFMRKIAAERQARLAGEIVAADFYLRQITMLEVTFDLTASHFGWDPREVLAKLQQIAHVGFRNVFVADPDIVEESNLNRLVGATAEDVARATPKASVASRTMRGILPKGNYRAERHEWERHTVDLRSVDVVVGCVDSLGQRAALETFCRRFLIPYIDIGMDVARSGDAFKIYGQIALSMPGRPCLRCMGIIDDATISAEERARQYGDAGSKPQVVWPNGVLASTAVGLLVQLFAPWSGQAVDSEHLEYDGNCGTIRRAPRMDAIISHGLVCDHFNPADVGDPLFSLGI